MAPEMETAIQKDTFFTLNEPFELDVYSMGYTIKRILKYKDCEDYLGYENIKLLVGKMLIVNPE